MLRVTHQPIGYSDGQHGVVSELAAFIEQLKIRSLDSAMVEPIISPMIDPNMIYIKMLILSLLLNCLVSLQS